MATAAAACDKMRQLYSCEQTGAAWPTTSDVTRM